MKVPLELLRDDFDSSRARSRRVQVQVRPDSLTENSKHHENNSGNNCPRDLELVAPVSVDSSSITLSPKLHHGVSKGDLRGSERDSHDDQRATKLRIDRRRMLGYADGEPPQHRAK